MSRTVEIPPFGTGLYKDGEEITDLETAQEALAVLFPGETPEVEPDGAGGWLVDLPADVTVDVLFSGGWYEHEEGGYRLEIELP